MRADESSGRLSESDELARAGWQKIRRDDSELTAEQREQLDQLLAIGYVGGSMESSRSGVTVYDRNVTELGLNFFTSGHAPEGFLMDMEGKILHHWRYAFLDAWPEAKDANMAKIQWWRRAYLFENGDVLAIFEGHGIIKLDRDSNLIWANPIRAHHDLEVRPNGDIYVLTREIRENQESGDLYYEDFFTVLDAEGHEKRSISLPAAFERSPHRGLLRQGKPKPEDLLHTNTVHVLDARLADREPAFRRGNILTSMNALGVIAVLDLDSEEIVWARREPQRKVRWLGQHDPQILDNGNMLYFDNHHLRNASRVTEIDPVTGDERWFYEASPRRAFYSPTCGAVQRLANANTLVTETDGGRAFEVDEQGEIVWEFYNPKRAGSEGEYIATISEMLRLPPDFEHGWASAVTDRRPPATAGETR